MVKNVGGMDKVIRLVVGGYLVLGAFLLGLPPWGTTVLSVVGGIALATGAMGFCPAWTVFGLNTLSSQRHTLNEEGGLTVELVFQAFFTLFGFSLFLVGPLLDMIPARRTHNVCQKASKTIYKELKYVS